MALTVRDEFDDAFTEQWNKDKKKKKSRCFVCNKSARTVFEIF